MIRRNHALVLALAALCNPAFAADSSGKVSFDGVAWSVADAIAIDEDGATTVAFSDTAFDRAKMLADGRLDSFDLLRHRGNQLRLVLRDGAAEGCIHLVSLVDDMVKSGSSCRSDFDGAVKVTVVTPTRVAGTMQWQDKDAGEAISLTFDVARAAPVASTPLPADGGAPGRALATHVALIAAGDWEAFKAAAAPERRAMMEASEAEGEHLEMFEFVRMVTPSTLRVTGGRQEGDFADVDYVSEDAESPGKGSARLQQVDGRWYVLGLRSGS